MTIWIYENTFSVPSEEDVTRRFCIFCYSRMDCISSTENAILQGEIRICETCGWWCRNERSRTIDFDGFDESGIVRHFYSMAGACAQLKNLDLSDITIPLDEMHAYLIARYKDRFDVDPRRLEELVASVFKNYGYESEATAFQNDGGIDVILSQGDNKIGVQVKRYKNRIEAEQIRSLAGSLMLGDITAGMFVTTSKFRSGAYKAAKGFAARGCPIELIDASRFYDALKIRKHPVVTKENAEEFVYGVHGIGESKVIYEKAGPY